MDPQFWLEKWEKAETGFHLDAANPVLERHWPPPGIAAAGPVLVPLCGKSLDLIWLRCRGHPVVGVELSPLAVEAFFREAGRVPEVRDQAGMKVWEADGIRIFQGDFFALSRKDLPDIGAVYDRAALVAMPPASQARYSEHLHALAPVPVLLVTLEYDTAEMQGPPFSTPAEQVGRLFAARYRTGLLETGDVLAENPGLAARGLTGLAESVWSLVPLDRTVM